MRASVPASGARKVLRMLGTVTAGAMLGLGMLILLGRILPERTPGNLRLMTGLVMILYGSYRSLVLLFARKGKPADDAGRPR